MIVIFSKYNNIPYHQAVYYEKYSTASDVWSFGCIMYELWSLGHIPFENVTSRNYITAYRQRDSPCSTSWMSKKNIQTHD